MELSKQHLKTGKQKKNQKIRLDRKHPNELNNNDPLTICISNSGRSAKSKVIAFSYLYA